MPKPQTKNPADDSEYMARATAALTRMRAEENALALPGMITIPLKDPED